MAKWSSFVGEWMLLKILADLPPKTLIRFKCVSKWWYNFISNPMFIAKHLSNSTNKSTSIFLKRLANDYEAEIPPKQALQVFSLLTCPNYSNEDDDHSILAGVKDIDLPLAMHLRNVSVDYLCIKGHCDGIICLEANHSDVFIWNPSIGECHLLSPEPYLPKWYNSECSPKDWPAGETYRPGHCFLQSMGLGYDPKSKDYKIIDIGLSHTPVEELDEGLIFNIMHPPRAVVYSLATDSWREIKTDSLETETTNLWPESFEIYYNGMCYWIGHEQDKEINYFEVSNEENENIRDVIISFDTSNEVFHDILLPDSLCGSFNRRLVLWNESIALFGSDRTHTGYISFGIWLMDERNGAWTKHIAFEPTQRALAFYNSDEILMVDMNMTYGRVSIL